MHLYFYSKLYFHSIFRIGTPVFLFKTVCVFESAEYVYKCKKPLNNFFPDFTKEERKGCLLYFLTFQMDQITCPIQIRRRIQWPVHGDRLYFVFFVRPQLQMYHCWLIAVSFVNWDEVHKSDTCNKKSGSMKYSLGVVVSILPAKKGLFWGGSSGDIILMMGILERNDLWPLIEVH